MCYCVVSCWCAQAQCVHASLRAGVTTTAQHITTNYMTWTKSIHNHKSYIITLCWFTHAHSWNSATTSNTIHIITLSITLCTITLIYSSSHIAIRKLTTTPFTYIFETHTYKREIEGMSHRHEVLRIYREIFRYGRLLQEPKRSEVFTEARTLFHKNMSESDPQQLADMIKG